MENRFQVVLSGEIAGGAQIDDVKRKMAALFKVAPSAVDAMFRRKNQIIKKNIDRETAEKYRRAIERTGAVCRMEPMAPAAAAKPAAPVAERGAAPAEKPARSGPNVVPIQLIFRGEERFTPQAAEKLTAAPGGVNFNIIDFNRIGFDQLTAMAAFITVDGGREAIRLLLYTSTRPRPFICDIGAIAYPEFQIQALANPLATFRNFLHFLCRQQSAIILEEMTFDFLSGSTLPKYDPAKADKLATAIGKLIESGEEAG